MTVHTVYKMFPSTMLSLLQLLVSCPLGSQFDSGLFHTYAYRFKLCGLEKFAYGTVCGVDAQSGVINLPATLLP